MTETTSPTDSTNPLKTLGILGAGALATAGLVIGAAGLAGAQDDEPTLEDPAPTEDSTTLDERRATHDARHQAMIDELVEDGTITEDQVDDWNAVRDALMAQRDAHRLEQLQGIAGVLDMTVDELQAARQSGESLAEIAGDDLDAVVDYFTAEATDRINQAVADDMITQEQADERLDGLADRIASRLENGGGFGGRGGHGGRGHGGRGHNGHGPRGGDGFGGGAATDAAEVTASFT